MRGRHARAIRGLRESAWALARRGANRDAAAALAMLARLLLRRGRAEQAVAAFDDALRVLGSVPPPAALAGWRALALAEAGRPGDALAACAEAPPATGPDARWWRVVRVRCAWLASKAPDGEWLDVDAAAWTGETDLEQQVIAGDTVVRTMLAAGRVFDAGGHARSLLEVAAAAGDVHAEAVARAAHVAVLARTGDRVLVSEVLETALRCARAAGAPVVAAHARLAAGGAFEQLGWEAGACRQRRHLERRRGVLSAAARAAVDVWLRTPEGRHLASDRTATDSPAVAVPVLPGAIGRSEAMAAVGALAARAAGVPFPVLIEGESGVGKELVARGIHELGPRRDRAFCAINCAAFPDDLLDAELFGHARGAFTGAVAARAGLLEAADGGTLFLDEVADLTPRAQAKLLRVLQEGEVRRIGETVFRGVDVRVVAAANRSLASEVTAGRFRADLAYRLDVVRVRVPPLRERRDDVPLLAHAFWKDAAARAGTRAVLPDAVIAALVAYEWPGNVRELQNVMAALAVSAPPSGRVPCAALPRRIAGARIEEGDLWAATAKFERGVITDALARTAGNRTRAATALGLTRQGLRKKMARLGLAPPASGTRGA